MTNLKEDLEQLKKHKDSIEIKSQIIDKITKLYDHDDFDAKEKAQAAEIIRYVVNKGEEVVKAIIAKNLKNNTEIDKGIILALAHDKNDVSLPVVEYSPLLTNQDLIQLVNKSESEDFVCAVARRNDVRKELGEAIVFKNFYDGIKTLMNNLNSEVSDSAYHFVLDNYHQDDLLKDVVRRNDMPKELVEKIAEIASEEVKAALKTKYKSHPHQEEVLKTLEKEVVAAKNIIIKDLQKAEEMESTIQYVEKLAAEKKITPHLVMQTICRGELLVFTLILAKLSKMPYPSAYQLVYTEGITSFYDLYKAAAMPKNLYPAISILIKTIFEHFPNGQNATPEKITNVLIKEITENQYQKKIYMMGEILEALFEQQKKNKS